MNGRAAETGAADEDTVATVGRDVIARVDHAVGRAVGSIVATDDAAGGERTEDDAGAAVAERGRAVGEEADEVAAHDVAGGGRPELDAGAAVAANDIAGGGRDAADQIVVGVGKDLFLDAD